MARRVPAGWTEDTEDEWVSSNWHRQVARPTEMLAPDRYYSSSHRRSRSTGAPPAPNVTVYNTIRNEDDHSPDRYSRRRPTRYDDDLVDAVEDVAREVRRGRSPAPPPPMPGSYRDPSPYMAMEMVARERERSRWELERERDHLESELNRDRMEARERAEVEAQLIRTRGEIRRLKERLEDEERDHRRHDEQDRYKRDAEYERLKDDIRRKDESERHKSEKELILLEHEREEREHREKRRLDRLEWERKERDEEDDRKRVVGEYRLKEEKEKQKRKEEEEAAIAAYKKRQDEDKKKRDDLVAQIKQEEQEKKDKEKAEKEMWRLRIEREEQEEKDKKKKKEEEMNEEMRKKLARFGFQNNQVEAILDPKKTETLRPGQSPGNALVVSKPTYIRIHRTHVDVETLRYFGLPFEYDTTDSNYLVILQELDHHETEILFEHTRKLRKGASTLLIEDRGRKNNPQYAFVRRRSTSRRKSSPKRVSVNLGGLFG